MTILSPTCGGFSFTRQFRKAPAEVFSAFTNLETKMKWFKGPPAVTELERSLECRVGGKEVLKGKWTSGMVTHFVSTYHVVEKDQRLVYCYDLHIDGVAFSTSLADVVFKPKGSGTEIIFTEVSVYYGDKDVVEANKSREHGTSWHFDNLTELMGG